MKDNNNISKELLEIIERYINGSMTSEELKDFNQLLELDNDLKTKVNDIKTMPIGIETKTPKDIVKNTSKNKNHFFYYNKILIVTALIIAIGSIWFFSTPKNERLYSEFFKPTASLATTSNSNNVFNNATKHYNHGDYNLAIKNWSVLQERKPENDSLNYFLGIAHLANKNITNAIPFLERSIEAEDDFTFLDSAYLYLGLAYLKEGNLKLAKKHLNISETETAARLLLELTK